MLFFSRRPHCAFFSPVQSNCVFVVEFIFFFFLPPHVPSTGSLLSHTQSSSVHSWKVEILNLLIPRCCAANDGAGCCYLSQTEARCARRGSPFLTSVASSFQLRRLNDSSVERRTESGRGNANASFWSWEAQSRFFCVRFGKAHFDWYLFLIPALTYFILQKSLAENTAAMLFFFLTSCLAAKHFGFRAKTSDRFTACMKNEAACLTRTPLRYERFFEFDLCSKDGPGFVFYSFFRLTRHADRWCCLAHVVTPVILALGWKLHQTSALQSS